MELVERHTYNTNDKFLKELKAQPALQITIHDYQDTFSIGLTSCKLDDSLKNTV